MSPMLYDLRHRVTYRYDTAVPESRQIIRMMPVTRDEQIVTDATLTVVPTPVEREDRRDFFGNVSTGVVIGEPHTELIVETLARISVNRGTHAAMDRSATVEEIRRRSASWNGLFSRSPVHFVFATQTIPLLPDIAAYARPSFTGARSVGHASLEFAHRIKSEFAYDPHATDVATPVQASFDARAGVCQDFAQIMLSGLRSLGIPGRYVSGYLRTNPPPGEPRLEGADATHAWIDVWCGADAGWIGIDPTNAVFVRDDHIVLAIGRDYADVAPIDGVIRLYGGHNLEVGVDVVPIEEVGADDPRA